MSGKGGLMREYTIRILAPAKLLNYIFHQPIQQHQTMMIKNIQYACLCAVNGSCKCAVYYKGDEARDSWDVLLTESILDKK
ncbi:Hypothetical protein PACV_143 [Pacmanvirus A23]|uniref:Hypothetical protein n=1 Tax=Pacmanvirus A23 TaxID=1932881 RepID=UPI000A0925E9|nr:Hypothetical protein B9W72_gp141 [Pacmanvirus A23]SIP85858.1 Hypothetical protein PACV_143 [Pacmanvirus A23]